MGHSGQQLIEEIHRLRRREPVSAPPEDVSLFEIHTDLTLAELERAYILRILDHTGGNQRRAAEILGINPSTLWRRMKRYQT